MQQPIPHVLSAAALALLVGVAPAHANEDKSDTSGASGAATASEQSSGASASDSSQAGAGQVARQDRRIMRNIAQANLAEIKTGQLALERSQNPQIRQFAQRMVDDHTQLQAQLTELARTKEVQLPQQPDAKQRELSDRLAKLQGEEFDSTYRREVGEQAHQRTHKLLERAQKQAQDPQLRAMVTQALPIISQHLTLAENLPDDSTRSTGASDAGTQDSGASSGAAASSGSGSSAPAGESGASMSTTDSSGASNPGEEAQSGAESISGTSGSSNMKGPGK